MDAAEKLQISYNRYTSDSFGGSGFFWEQNFI